MEHHFSLSVQHNNKALSFPARLVTFGYNYTYYVVVDKQEIIFERDEENNLRAITSIGHAQVDVGLLEAITSALEKREFLQTV